MCLNFPLLNSVAFGAIPAEGLLRGSQIPARLNGDGASDPTQERAVDVRDDRSQFASDAVRRIRLSKPVQLSVHASNSQMRCHGVRLSQAFIGHAKEGLQ